MAATAMEGAAADPRLTEAKKYEYFSSINSMARKIMQEREKIKEKYGEAWEDMSPAEQDTAIDDGMMEPKVRARYAMHRTDREEVVCYPKLLIQTGQKTVHFGEEDLTWQDEHSAPFSWETKSQLEFSVITGAPESSSSSSTSSSVPEPKPKTPGPEVSVSARRDEEASFWKLNAERSRLEGEKADFQSLTPSQIKSLEKGEKPLPSYMRSDSVPKEAAQEPAAPRPVKPRVTKPPAPPPPAPVGITPAPLSVNLSVTPTPISIAPPPSAPLGGWERSQSTLPSVSSTLEDVFSPGLSAKTPLESTHDKEKEDDNVQAGSPAFSQYNTSSSILKTGFDFLDNW